jgi:putative Holliday junction resolvase
MRLLALDIGEVRIGVAVSDSLEFGANPVTTVRRTGSLKRDIEAIAAVAVEREAEAVVAGLPLSLDGDIGPQARRIQGFVEALRKIMAIPIVYWDESLTSVEANERMIAMDISRARRREMIDQIAAVILLESYLDHRRVTNAPRDSLVMDDI